LLIFIPLGLSNPLSYLVNSQVVTNKRVFIRKARTGSLISFNFNDVKAYSYFVFSHRGEKHRMLFYLKNGKKVSIGATMFTNDSWSKLERTLKRKFVKPVKTRAEVRRKNFDKTFTGNIKRENNIFLKIISFAPIVIALVMLLLYVGGVNEKVGDQQDIKVLGRIEKKVIDRNSDDVIVSAELIISSVTDDREYTIDVNEDTYNRYFENDKVLVRAKKGSLGIVYDIRIYKQ